MNRLISFKTESLSDFNINAIVEISEFLGLDCEFVKQSDLNTTANSTELLIEILQCIGSDAYLSGNGAKGYMRPELFEHNSIKLSYVSKDEIFIGKTVGIFKGFRSSIF